MSILAPTESIQKSSADGQLPDDHPVTAPYGDPSPTDLHVDRAQHHVKKFPKLAGSGPTKRPRSRALKRDLGETGWVPQTGGRASRGGALVVALIKPLVLPFLHNTTRSCTNRLTSHSRAIQFTRLTASIHDHFSFCHIPTAILPSTNLIHQLTPSQSSLTTVNMHASAVVAFAFAAVVFAQVTQIGDGQPQAPTSVAAPVSEFTDGQPQVTIASSSAYVSASSSFRYRVVSFTQRYLINTLLFAVVPVEVSVQAC